MGLIGLLSVSIVLAVLFARSSRWVNKGFAAVVYLIAVLWSFGVGI